MAGCRAEDRRGVCACPGTDGRTAAADPDVRHHDCAPGLATRARDHARGHGVDRRLLAPGVLPARGRLHRAVGQRGAHQARPQPQDRCAGLRLDRSTAWIERPEAATTKPPAEGTQGGERSPPVMTAPDRLGAFAPGLLRLDLATRQAPVLLEPPRPCPAPPAAMRSSLAPRTAVPVAGRSRGSAPAALHP